jgi:large subunit ribosomal protein L18
MHTAKKLAARQKRKAHIRKTLIGTTERPRLSVYRSIKHIYAQVIDDSTGRTLVSAASNEAEIAEGAGELKKADVAKKVGQVIAKRCLEKQIAAVAFDRNGFIYHGRVAKVAEGAREGGLKF